MQLCYEANTQVEMAMPPDEFERADRAMKQAQQDFARALERAAECLRRAEAEAHAAIEAAHREFDRITDEAHDALQRRIEAIWRRSGGPGSDGKRGGGPRRGGPKPNAPTPVRPDRPNLLSGGAEAEL